MSGVLRYLKRIFGLQLPARPPPTFATRDTTRYAEGDRLLIDNERLSPPLQRNANTPFKRGVLDHNAIIGQSIGPIYTSTSKGAFKVELPTLDQYVSLTPRLVTPVYASYASTIVSLLDINPVPFDGQSAQTAERPALEILEAGTGHGSLTLHIARAIAAANPTPPGAALSTPEHARKQESVDTAQVRDACQEAWDQWKRSRRAVLHTVEAVPENRRHAEKVVRGFRQGVYWPHVDFNEGDVGNWIAAQVKRRYGSSMPNVGADSHGFLNAVILDMPGVHKQLPRIRSVVRDGGRVLVFVPSITQIGECARIIAENDLPFLLDRVLELGEGISSGRKWDVRLVVPKKGNIDKIKAATKADPALLQDEGGDGDNIDEVATAADEQGEPVMVCRPMVGEKTFGGGFVALWTKMSPATLEAELMWRKGQTGWAARKRFR